MTPEEELRARLNEEECAKCSFLDGTCDWFRPMPNGFIYVPPCFMPRQTGGDDDGSS